MYESVKCLRLVPLDLDYLETSENVGDISILEVWS
jgi:hypothetical protein